MRESFQLLERGVGVPEFDSMPFSTCGDQPVGKIPVSPVKFSSKTCNWFCNGQDLETFQSVIEPFAGIRTRQFSGLPLPNDLHAGDWTEIPFSGSVSKHCLDLPREWQPAYKPEPYSRISKNLHGQISSKTGSSILMPLYGFGSSGFSTRQG